MKINIIPLLLGVVIMSLFIGYLVYATGPGIGHPPVHTGPEGQIKDGPL